MQWRHTTSSKPKKFKPQKSAGKIMATVFWDAQGLLLVDFLPKGKTFTSEAYIKILQKLRARIRHARPQQLEIKKVFLQHNNARPQTSIKTRNAITSFRWTTVPHPLYSPDLAPSNYPLFGAMKEELKGKHYANDEEVKTAARNWLRSQPSEFYKAEIHALIQRWKTAVEKDDDYVEK